MFTPVMFASILPEILILVLAVILLCVEPFWKEDQRRNAGWLTAGGLFAIIIVSLLFGQPGEPTSVFGDMIRFDWLGFFFKILFMFAAAVTALLLMDHEKAGQRGEAYLLLLASLLGMNLMAVSADLIMLYLAIETASIPLYILAGFMLADDRSTEAGFKYLLFGTLASTIMLYGFSLIFGFAGTTNLYQLSEMFALGEISVLACIRYLRPRAGGTWLQDCQSFHSTSGRLMCIRARRLLWLVSFPQPPKPRALRLSFASSSLPFPDYAPSWTLILAVLSAITMTVGNLLAMSQTNIKRLLAYSSIAHAGYALIGVVAFSQLGAASVVFYLAAYIVTNLLAFGVVMAFSRVTGAEDIKDYAGMSRRNPWLALMMLGGFPVACGYASIRRFRGERSLSLPQACKPITHGWLSSVSSTPSSACTTTSMR